MGKNKKLNRTLAASTQDLLKKQREEEVSPPPEPPSMALIAAEAAAQAAARSEKIRRRVIAVDNREVNSNGEETGGEGGGRKKKSSFSPLLQSVSGRTGAVADGDREGLPQQETVSLSSSPLSPQDSLQPPSHQHSPIQLHELLQNDDYYGNLSNT